MPQHAGAHHRGERKRDHRRDQDGHGQGHGKFAEQPSDHVAHEQQGNQHGNQREGERHDGEANLRRTTQGRLQRGFAFLDVTADVFDHDDGIVHHESCGNRQRHQGQVVDAVVAKVHHAQGADQGQRHGDAWNEGGAQIAQEQIDHQHHQCHRETEFECHVLDRSPDGGGAVADHLQVHSTRERGLELRQQGLDMVCHADHVRTRLALDVDNHGSMGAIPGRELVVLGGFDHAGDVAQPDGRAIAEGYDHRAVFLRRFDLVVGIDGRCPERAVETALGDVGIGIGDGSAHVFQPQAEACQGSGIDLDAHRRPLPAGNADQPHPCHLGQFLRHPGVDQVIDLRQGQIVRRGGEAQDWRVGRIDLAVHRRQGQVDRQQVAGGIDGGLYFLLGHIQACAERELQGDHRRPPGAGGQHLLQPRHLAELPLEWGGDRRGHHVRAGPGIEGGDLDGGVVHLRQGRQGQEAQCHQPGQEQGQHQQRRPDGTEDEWG